jgi:predicted HTH domain antitoxin
MTELSGDLETIAAIGGCENTDAVVSDAVRELLRQRSKLHLSVAVEKYRSVDVSLNRAVELAGVSAEQLKDELSNFEAEPRPQ